ncbi:hypothetical protein TNCV_3616081 [Trichonephila clavipes]|nr:hypothetical protein TNCV_3616081 [Trichonephila clavipes]
MFDHRKPLINIDGRLTTNRYVTLVVELVVLPLLQGSPNMVFQQGNARPHIAWAPPVKSAFGHQAGSCKGLLTWRQSDFEPPRMLPPPTMWELGGGGLGLNPEEGMDVCKSIEPLRHGGTLNSRRAACSLYTSKGRESSDHFQGVLQNSGGIELNRTVTCMMLKAKANVWCTTSPLPQ